MKKKITLKHIARELEVSVSTVSKALRNSDEIGRDTKEKVQAFARLYNYKPNNIAISLKNKQTKNIGVIIPNIVHHFFTTVFRGIEKYASDRGYNVIVCVSDESFDKEVINMEMLANGSVDGFIMALSGATQRQNDFNHITEVMGQGIPVVLFDRVTDQVNCDKVVINDRQIAYEAVLKFLANGRERIALVTNESYFNVSEERANGYIDALKDNGRTINENLILTLAYDHIDENVITGFFEREQIDAVLCVNEIFAVCCMGIAQKLGYKVPEDIAFIGFTDGILSRHSRPSLTTVAQHGEQMGEMAAKLLIEKIEKEINDEDMEQETYRTEIIKATIMERDSTDN
ncbi:LacI family DNA-binding transcriptional regulator [Maribacter algicola]|uniref:LacI family DNA-binding transcriptional regulator n=1 Tax=Meishania litoralis TaxID=3434685 RepID=A0ACC7LNB3_9FLAO